MIISVITLSFVLESILSNFISIQTKLLNPLFSILSLIILYPYFYNKEKSYYLTAIILGIFYDVVYTNTLCLNAVVFLIIAFLIKKMNIWISNNIINVTLMALIIIIVYRSITYFLLIIINYLKFKPDALLNSILSSIIINVLYVVFAYLITDYISKKKHIHKID